MKAVYEMYIHALTISLVNTFLKFGSQKKHKLLGFPENQTKINSL